MFRRRYTDVVKSIYTKKQRERVNAKPDFSDGKRGVTPLRQPRRRHRPRRQMFGISQKLV
jgi:hypothetical protein